MMLPQNQTPQSLQYMPPSEGQMRYLSQSIRLKESTSPGIVRGTMVAICTTFAAFFVWSALANVQEISHAPGEVVPGGFARSVQHAEGGSIAALYVHEGDSVTKGQKLLLIDGSDIQDDLARTKSRQAVIALQEERLRAFIEGRAPQLQIGADEMKNDTAAYFSSMTAAKREQAAVIKQQISQKRQSLGALHSALRAAQANAGLTADLMRKRKNLNAQGVLSDVKLMDTQQKFNEQNGETASLRSQIAQANDAIAEYQSRLQSLNADSIDDAHRELETVSADMAQNADLAAKLEKRLDRLTVIAPVDGVIKGLAVKSAGNVAQPGQTLMEIVPVNEEMVVNVKIPPRDIGHVRVGEDVQVKFSSYDFARYGSVKGELSSISATTFDGENGDRYYEGKIKLLAAHVGNSVENKIMPGMTVMADIATGHKTILQYLLKPVQTAMSTSFSER